MSKKYKLTLLKDLPNVCAGTELLNVTEEQLNGKEKFECYGNHHLLDIFHARNNTDFVKIEEDTRCDCETKDFIGIRYAEVGYGRKVLVNLNFQKKKIYTWYDYACDSGTEKSLDIQYCPLCGRKL